MNSRNQEARRGLGHKVLPFDREDKKRPCPGMEKNRATEVEASPYHGTIGPFGNGYSPVDNSPVKPPALLERITAALQLRE